MTLTYSDSESLISKARDAGNGKPLRNHTRLYKRGGSYAVQLHSTDVVTVNPDGTYVLDTGGWYTVTTKDRINDYSPARVASSGGATPVWCVWHPSDPVTAPKVQKCRICGGTGHTTRPGWTETHGYLTSPSYEVKDEYVTRQFAWPPLPTHRTDGSEIGAQPRSYTSPGHVVRHDSGTYGRLQTPIVHPPVTSDCYACGGSGRRDYGSKRNPVRFYDGIMVDATGKVTDPDAPRLYDHLPADDANAVVLKAIAAYVAGLTDEKITQLWEHAASEGTAGDCWYCSMFEPAGARDDSHLRGHVCLPVEGEDLQDEPYYMASLIRNALKARGYRDPLLIFQLGTTGGSGRGSTIRESVSRYLKKRLIKDRPTR